MQAPERANKEIGVEDSLPRTGRSWQDGKERGLIKGQEDYASV